MLLIPRTQVPGKLFPGLCFTSALQTPRSVRESLVRCGGGYRVPQPPNPFIIRATRLAWVRPTRLRPEP